MRFRSKMGERHIVCQRNCGSVGKVALKTAKTGGEFLEGTWVYLDKDTALQLVSQILLCVTAEEEDYDEIV